MGVVHYISDRLTNLVANLGTDRDKAKHTHYVAAPLTDDQLVNAYRYAWLPRKVVDIPAMDATREWREWQGEAEQVEALEAIESRFGLQRKVKSALISARLFGGAAIYIGTNETNLARPLGANTEVQHLTVLTRRQLTAGEVEYDSSSPDFGQPAYYTLSGTSVDRIHPSRLVIFMGNERPDQELSDNLHQGWGDSVLFSLIQAVEQADGTAANIASLIYEAQIDVVKIPGLMEGMTDPAWEKQVLERLTLAGKGKSINGMLVLDAEEDYEQKSASLANLRDILMAFMQVVSGAADIPVTRLLGESPAGLNATGESDLRNYYDRVKAEQTLEIGPALAHLDELLIHQALGSRPPEVTYEWVSLWQPSMKDQAEVDSKTAEAIKKLSESLVIPEDALSEAAAAMLRNRGVMPDLDLEVSESPDDVERGM